MRKVQIEINEEDLICIREFLDYNSGKIDLQKLIELLLSDVALAIRRPGSWEGANMINVLQSHGYHV